jgi:hypothetical protein
MASGRNGVIDRTSSAQSQMKKSLSAFATAAGLFSIGIWFAAGIRASLVASGTLFENHD